MVGAHQVRACSSCCQRLATNIYRFLTQLPRAESPRVNVKRIASFVVALEPWAKLALLEYIDVDCGRAVSRYKSVGIMFDTSEI